MEAGDPLRVLKCSGGIQDKTIINRIMLSFRPIAPKPVTGASGSGDSLFGNKNLIVTGKRAKRKYVRVCTKNNRRKRKISDEAKEEADGKKNFVTLQLMPEKADLEKSMVVERSFGEDLDGTVGNYHHSQDPPISLCLKLKKLVKDEAAVVGFSDQKAVVSSTRSRRPVRESWVTVESVIDTCMDEGEIGDCTDVERLKNLEKDTCPGFISDGLNRVLWVNPAYNKMVATTAQPDTDDDEEGAGTAVGLVVKDSFKFTYGAFSCRVRLQYGEEKGKKLSKMVPCDVWKMKSGGFAWRLDVRAALSLGF